MPTAFAKAFIKKAQKVFPGAKKFTHRTGRSFGNAPVPDGTFTAVVTAETSVISKGKFEGVPTVRFRATIDQGPYEGLEPSKVFFCEGKPVPTDPDEFPTAEQQLIGLLGFLLPDIQIDEVSEVEAAIELVNERGPTCLIGVRNRKVGDKEYQDVFFNKIIKGQSFAVEDSSPSQAASSDAETTPDSTEYVPVKGDMVFLDGEDTEYEVAQVSQSRKTANLIDQDGTRKTSIAWADLQPA